MNIKKILGFSIGPVGAALLGAVSLPLSTWMFGVEDIGRISLLQTLTNLMIILLGLGLDQSYVREYHHTPERRVLFHLVIKPGLIFFSILTIIVLFTVPREIAKLIFGLDEVGLAYGAMIAIFFSFCSRYFSLILRMEERGLAFSISQILPKLIFLGCLLIIYLNGIPTTFWMLLGIHISGAAIAMLFFALNTRHVWFDTTVIEKTETVKLNNLMAYGFPLMLAGLAFWVVEAIDKVMLRYLSNFSDLGVYSVTVGIASIAGMLSIIFTTVWMPTVYSWGENVNSAERIEGVAKKLVILGSLLICISGVFSWILKYILPDEYILAQYLIPLCMVPSVLYAAAEVTGSGLGITRRNRPLVFITLATCLINIIFNWLFIPVLGATGAAIATAIAYFSFFILRTEVSMHNFKTMQRRPLYIPTGLVIILAILFSLVGSFNPIIGIVVWVIATFSFLFVARNIFLMMLSNLKKIKF